MKTGPAPVTQRPCRIALLGPYASRNLGDTATQLAVIANLRQRRPDLQIVGLSPDPDDTLRSLEIAAFPLTGRGPASGSLAMQFPAPSHAASGPHGWLRVRRRNDAVARSLDLLVISGGGQLDDYWGGAFGHPWAMLEWSALARRHGVPVAFLGVGLDRLSTRLSRAFALRALRLASYRSFRDGKTLQAMQKLGLREQSTVCPDVAFSLSLSAAVREAARSQRKFAVINPISHKTWSHTTDMRHDEYLSGLVDAGAWLAAQGLSLRIACSQWTMDNADAKTLAQIFGARGIVVELCETHTVDDYLAQVSGAEVVIAARLHGAILALVAGSPVVALSPQPKLQHVMEDAGLAHLCLPLQAFDAGQLIERVAHVLRRVAETRTHIAATNARFRTQLARTFDDLLALSECSARPAATDCGPLLS